MHAVIKALVTKALKLEAKADKARAAYHKEEMKRDALNDKIRELKAQIEESNFVAQRHMIAFRTFEHEANRAKSAASDLFGALPENAEKDTAQKQGDFYSVCFPS